MIDFKMFWGGLVATFERGYYEIVEPERKKFLATGCIDGEFYTVGNYDSVFEALIAVEEHLDSLSDDETLAERVAYYGNGKEAVNGDKVLYLSGGVAVAGIVYDICNVTNYGKIAEFSKNDTGTNLKKCFCLDDVNSEMKQCH